MRKLLCFLALLGLLAFPTGGAAYDFSKDVQIFLDGGVSQIVNGVHQDIVQTGTPVSKHLIVVPTTSYAADGHDQDGNKICLFYLDLAYGLKVYVSVEPREYVDIFAEENEVFKILLLDASRVVEEEGGMKTLIRRCENNAWEAVFKPAIPEIQAHDRSQS